MERFQREVGIRLSHAPYRGGAPGLNDLIAGNLESQLIDFATGGEAMRSGQIRPIAAASGARFEALPDLPTFRELGRGTTRPTLGKVWWPRRGLRTPWWSASRPNSSKPWGRRGSAAGCAT